jgi:predicted permease
MKRKKGQMTLLAIFVTMMTLIAFLAIVPALKEIISEYWDNFTPIEKVLVGLIIPMIFIGILSIITLYSKLYYREYT